MSINNVLLTIDPGVPGRQNISTYPQQLPALPQVGHVIAIVLPEQGYRYVCQVSEVVFGMTIEGELEVCRTTGVEIQCQLIHRQQLR